jgi:hypothetical protein
VDAGRQPAEEYIGRKPRLRECEDELTECLPGADIDGKSQGAVAEDGHDHLARTAFPREADSTGHVER